MAMSEPVICVSCVGVAVTTMGDPLAGVSVTINCAPVNTFDENTSRPMDGETPVAPGAGEISVVKRITSGHTVLRLAVPLAFPEQLTKSGNSATTIKEPSPRA